MFSNSDIDHVVNMNTILHMYVRNNYEIIIAQHWQKTKIIFLFFNSVKVSHSAGRFHFPWSENVKSTKSYLNNELFVTHPALNQILYHFQSKLVHYYLRQSIVTVLCHFMPFTT